MGFLPPHWCSFLISLAGSSFSPCPLLTSESPRLSPWATSLPYRHLPPWGACPGTWLKWPSLHVVTLSRIYLESDPAALPSLPAEPPSLLAWIFTVASYMVSPLCTLLPSTLHSEGYEELPQAACTACGWHTLEFCVGGSVADH